jgi:serine/threonine-protein kinase
MIGKIIGNYEITAELAQGGMGAVYRGRHRDLPREVVVKAILLSSFPPQAQQMLRARFRREAYVQSQLDHPNIVRVYEFFTTEENYYLVMEYVAGMSLRDLLKRQGALAPDRATALFKQALAALDYAHNFSYVDESGGSHSGIIHRDIKPANLLLDGMARLKLTDFGIVKLAGEKGLTRTGFNPGTVEYMSPEQIRGAEVDARSDIYSLGVVFYEMLAGRLPFPASDTGSEYEVMRGHMELAPPPIAQLRPNVPAKLAAMVSRSLEKDPNDRFLSAAEFLDAVLDFERRPAAGPSPVETGSLAAAAPKPAVTHSMTELLDDPPRQSARDDLATNVMGSATPTSPPAGRETRPRPLTKPVEPEMPRAVAPPAKSGRAGLFIAAAIVLLGVAAVAAYLFLRPAAVTTPGEEQVATTSASPSTTPPAADDSRLQQARDAEAQDRYVDAIKLYSEHLNDGSQTVDKSAVAARVEELKKLQGLLSVAELEMKQGDYEAARRDYAEALKLRPESKLAQTGLKEAEGRLAR